MKSAGGQLWVLVAQLGSVLSMLCMEKKLSRKREQFISMGYSWFSA